MRRLALASGALAGLLILSACGTADIDAIAPAAATRPANAGPIDTGTYPNLNIARRGAAAPISPDEREAKLAELEATRNGQGRGLGPGISAADQARLLRLSRERAAARASTN